MTRAGKQMLWWLRHGWRRAILRNRWREIPRPGYCWCCGGWGWLTDEPAPYSTARGYLCEPCAEENDLNVSAAWADYYGGLL